MINKCSNPDLVEKIKVPKTISPWRSPSDQQYKPHFEDFMLLRRSQRKRVQKKSLTFVGLLALIVGDSRNTHRKCDELADKSIH